MKEEIDIEKAKEDIDYFCKEVLGLKKTVPLGTLKAQSHRIKGLKA